MPMPDIENARYITDKRLDTINFTADNIKKLKS